MGALIEINDTLRLNREQGFPGELNIAQHLETPYSIEDFRSRIFEFHSKQRIRVFQTPPIRNFLVEDVSGTWIYWGQIHILEIRHDYVRQQTSGKYQIIHINSPEEMRQAFNAIDRIWANDYFKASDD